MHSLTKLNYSHYSKYTHLFLHYSKIVSSDFGLFDKNSSQFLSMNHLSLTGQLNAFFLIKNTLNFK